MANGQALERSRQRAVTGRWRTIPHMHAEWQNRLSGASFQSARLHLVQAAVARQRFLARITAIAAPTAIVAPHASAERLLHACKQSRPAVCHTFVLCAGSTPPAPCTEMERSQCATALLPTNLCQVFSPFDNGLEGVRPGSHRRSHHGVVAVLWQGGGSGGGLGDGILQHLAA